MDCGLIFTSEVVGARNNPLTPKMGGFRCDAFSLRSARRRRWA
jgi:hypothetical protein